MKAVVFEKFGEAPTIQTVPDPKPAADGVVIKFSRLIQRVHENLASFVTESLEQEPRSLASHQGAFPNTRPGDD